MIQHMNLAFGADGLTVGEGAFLLACCNHTDGRGYVHASMQQLADEAHMKMTAAKSNKQRLIARGLLGIAERYHPKNGARITDLCRVNIDLLRSMQRKRKDYGATLIEEITFATPQECAGQTPPSESDRGGSESDRGGSASDGGAGSESDPLLLPSSSPSSLSGDPDVTPDPSAEAVTDERESSAARANDEGAVEAELVEHQEQDDADTVAAAFAAAWQGAHGVALTRPYSTAIRKQAAELLAAGYPVEHLVALAEDMAPRKWRNLTEHATHNPPRRSAGPAVEVSDPCPQHPHREAAECRPCQSGPTGPRASVPAQPAAPSAPAAEIPADMAEALAQVRAIVGKTPPPARKTRTVTSAAAKERAEEANRHRAAELLTTDLNHA